MAPSTYIKGLCGSFGNTLTQFTGDVGASLYMWTSSQDPLQHREGISLRTACHTTLTGNECVNQIVIVLHSELTYTHTRSHDTEAASIIKESNIVITLTGALTASVHRLHRRCTSAAADTEEPLTHLPQDRVLHTWTHKSDGTNVNIQLEWKPEHLH